MKVGLFLTSKASSPRREASSVPRHVGGGEGTNWDSSQAEKEGCRAGFVKRDPQKFSKSSMVGKNGER